MIRHHGMAGARRVQEVKREAFFFDTCCMSGTFFFRNASCITPGPGSLDEASQGQVSVHSYPCTRCSELHGR
jgi:hypothetical protein